MLSAEQRKVVEVVSSGCSVVCISKPGTGKTTVALECAKCMSGKTLVLTYNRKLKESTRDRVCGMQLDSRVEVHSYHAAARRFFINDDDHANDDTLIYAALQTSCPLIDDVSLLVIDEAQDLTKLYVNFVHHILRHLTQPPIMLLVGDPFQAIFRYLNADVDYMMRAPDHFAREFVQLQLTTCWRITPEMAQWVNMHMDPRHLQKSVPETWWEMKGPQLVEIWGDGIKAGKPSVPGSVCILQMDDTVSVHAEIRQSMNEFKSEECAFLAKSVRRASQLLANIVHNCAGAKWMVSHDSEWDAPDALPHGKAVLTTIHRFKGLERPFVCLVGLDAQWESHSSDPMELFCLYFVALTRATRKLLILTGTPSYATLRRTPLPPKSRMKTTPEVSSLLRHAPFCPVLSVAKKDDNDGALRVKLIARTDALSAKHVDAARLLPGRGGTMEDASPYLTDAINFKVRHLLNIPLDGIVHDILQSRAPPDVKLWARQCTNAWTCKSIFQLAVATHSAETRYSHHWRQVCATETLLKVISQCADIVAGLVRDMHLDASEEFTCRVAPFSEYSEAQIKVPTVLCSPECIVHIVTAPMLRHDTVLWAATVAALKSMHEHRVLRCFVVHSNKGMLFEIESMIDAQELVSRVATRK